MLKLRLTRVGAIELRDRFRLSEVGQLIDHRVEHDCMSLLHSVVPPELRPPAYCFRIVKNALRITMYYTPL
jgi:hypothetical protein